MDLESKIRMCTSMRGVGSASRSERHEDTMPRQRGAESPVLPRPPALLISAEGERSVGGGGVQSPEVAAPTKAARKKVESARPGTLGGRSGREDVMARETIETVVKTRPEKTLPSAEKGPENISIKTATAARVTRVIDAEYVETESAQDVAAKVSLIGLIADIRSSDSGEDSLVYLGLLRDDVNVYTTPKDTTILTMGDLLSFREFFVESKDAELIKSSSYHDLLAALRMFFLGRREKKEKELQLFRQFLLDFSDFIHYPKGSLQSPRRKAVEECFGRLDGRRLKILAEAEGSIMACTNFDEFKPVFDGLMTKFEMATALEREQKNIPGPETGPAKQVTPVRPVAPAAPAAKTGQRPAPAAPAAKTGQRPAPTAPAAKTVERPAPSVRPSKGTLDEAGQNRVKAVLQQAGRTAAQARVQRRQVPRGVVEMHRTNIMKALGMDRSSSWGQALKKLGEEGLISLVPGFLR